MSQHFIDVNYNGKQVKLITGWDSPFKRCFLVVQCKDEDLEDDDVIDGLIYSNLSDPDISCRFDDHDEIQYFQGVLNSMQIKLPEEIWNTVKLDRENDTGNSETHWNLDGTKKIV